MQIDWLSMDLQRFGPPPTETECAQMDDAARVRAHEIIERVRLDAATQSGDQATYAARIGKAATWHLNESAIRKLGWAAALKGTMDDVERGTLSYGAVSENVLEDVVLAVALEQRDNAGAARFERLFMPYVRAIASRVGGQRALDFIDNLAADIMLPRNNHPPRISTYRGRTPLKTWLRTVIANLWVSESRRLKPSSAMDPNELISRQEDQQSCELRDCEQLLDAPLREATASISAQDRTILKMLILDAAPQNTLARTLGINPGTLTRRKQRAASELLGHIGRCCALIGRPQAVEECLQLVLGGESREFRLRIASLIADRVSDGADGAMGAPS